GPSPDPEQYPQHVLDRGADGRPPQRQRLPVAAGRPVRFGYPVWRGAWLLRQPAGDHRGRQAPGGAGQRRGAQVPRGRRREHPARPRQPGRRGQHRLRRMPRQDPGGQLRRGAMELFAYYRSTSSYRVRIALALKGLDYQALPVNLLQGEQHTAGYLALNPQGRVPALRTDGGALLVQSPAIIEYLEEVHPQPALLPVDAEARAKVRGVAAIIGC